MATTDVQKLIRHKKRRSGMLVPLLEDLFMHPVEIEGPDDIGFVVQMLESQMMRQLDRKNEPLFSPSQLASCLRYVYLLKNHKEHGLHKVSSVRVEPNFYFFNGNWLHLKWQFALYKLDKMLGDPTIFKLLGTEVPIRSKHKDHGGTVDALVLLYGEPLIADFKGLNVRTFGEITRGYVPVEYLVQLTDYGMLYNAAATRGRTKGIPGITRGLLISENKGGPDPRHLIALHEHEVEISTHLPEVRRRLEVLREHESKKEIPKPECVSTSSFQFVSCPFRKFCKEEVQRIERRIKRAASEDSEGLRVESPSKRRNHRARRNSKR